MSMAICRKILGTCALALVVAAPRSTRAQEAGESAEAAADLTVITSDKLTFDYKEHFAHFQQNVVVVDPEMKLFADDMVVHFNDSNRVTEIQAEGKVYIVQEDKKARSDAALYDVARGVIVLTGKPQVTRGQDILTGDKITFWRDANKMIVEPRARLIIHSEGDRHGGALKGEAPRGR